MMALAATVAVLAAVVVCAVFRVNILSLLPWYSGVPKRLDDSFQTLSSAKPGDPDSADSRANPR